MPDGGSAPHEPERRRFPRGMGGGTAKLRMSVDVEVLDLSLTGALIRCECPLRVGDRAQMQTMLDGRAFVAWVSVVRIAAERGNGSNRPALGVAFLATGEHNADVLQRFLSRAS